MKQPDFNLCKKTKKMNTALKVVLGVLIFLGLLSGAFLLFSKKKTPIAQPTQKSATATTAKTVATATTQPETVNHLSPVQAADVAAQQNAAASATNDLANSQMRADWQACSKGNSLAGKVLYWRFSISETIPTGGTYAKGAVLGQPVFPVHITVRPASPDAASIKSRLVVSNNLVGLRGVCNGIASDGSVNFDAF